jgi:hypothetical protein
MLIFSISTVFGCSTNHARVEQPYPPPDEERRIISSNYDLMRTLPAEDYNRLMKEYYPHGYCGDNCNHTPKCTGFYLDYETGLIHDKPMRFK